jgi:hypothetical protein
MQIDEGTKFCVNCGAAVYTQQQPEPTLYTQQQPEPTPYTQQQPEPTLYTQQQPEPTLYTQQQPEPTLYTQQQPGMAMNNFTPTFETGSQFAAPKKRHPGLIAIIITAVVVILAVVFIFLVYPMFAEKGASEGTWLRSEFNPKLLNNNGISYEINRSWKEDKSAYFDDDEESDFSLVKYKIDVDKDGEDDYRIEIVYFTAQSFNEYRSDIEKLIRDGEYEEEYGDENVFIKYNNVVMNDWKQGKSFTGYRISFDIIYPDELLTELLTYNDGLGNGFRDGVVLDINGKVLEIGCQVEEGKFEYKDEAVADFNRVIKSLEPIS